MNAKDTVRSLLDRLPDDCSIEDVLYHLYVVQQIELGRAEAESGPLIPHEEVPPTSEKGPRRRGVIWTERAIAAANEALIYVASGSQTAAETLLTRVLDAAASLSELTERGRIVPELPESNLRGLIIPPYRLVYDYDDSRVRVLTLLHKRAGISDSADRSSIVESSRRRITSACSSHAARAAVQRLERKQPELQ